jgi:UDP:flavonoid glycosyltransferase YjiC (YdhE family)
VAQRKRIAVVAFGTLGDVFPIVGLAAALAKHCELTVVTSALYADYFRNASCRVVEALSAEGHGTAMNGVNLSAREGVLDYLANYLVGSLASSITELLEIDRRNPVDAFLGTGFINGAQWAAEILGKPYIRISLAPWSDKEVMLDEMGSCNRAIHAARMCVARAMLGLSALFHYVRFVNKFLNPIRRQFKLQKYGTTDVFIRPYAALRISLYPTSLLLPTSGRWPPITFTSFPLSDPSDEKMVRQTRDALGRCKQRPLVFVTGSAVTDILRDVQYAYSLCSLLGVPGIFVHSKVAQLGKRAYSNLSLLDFADLSCLLPHALLIVHHGGIGTIAQSLRAGIPQLVRPLAFDQADNARRIARLKAGAFLSAEQRYDVELSARLVSHLTSSPAISGATEKHRAEIAQSDGLGNASSLILRFLNGSTAHAR